MMMMIDCCNYYSCSSLQNAWDQNIPTAGCNDLSSQEGDSQITFFGCCCCCRWFDSNAVSYRDKDCYGCFLLVPFVASNVSLWLLVIVETIAKNYWSYYCDDSSFLLHSYRCSRTNLSRILVAAGPCTKQQWHQKIISCRFFRQAQNKTDNSSKQLSLSLCKVLIRGTTHQDFLNMFVFSGISTKIMHWRWTVLTLFQAAITTRI